MDKPTILNLPFPDDVYNFEQWKQQLSCKFSLVAPSKLEYQNSMVDSLEKCKELFHLVHSNFGDNLLVDHSGLIEFKDEIGTSDVIRSGHTSGKTFFSVFNTPTKIQLTKSSTVDMIFTIAHELMQCSLRRRTTPNLPLVREKGLCNVAGLIAVLFFFQKNKTSEVETFISDIFQRIISQRDNPNTLEIFRSEMDNYTIGEEMVFQYVAKNTLIKSLGELSNHFIHIQIKY